MCWWNTVFSPLAARRSERVCIVRPSSSIISISIIILNRRVEKWNAVFIISFFSASGCPVPSFLLRKMKEREIVWDSWTNEPLMKI